MKLSYRTFLVDDATGALRKVASARYMAAYMGGGALPEHAGQDIRVLTVLCRIENRRIASVAKIDGMRLRIGQDGYADQKPISRHVSAVLHGLSEEVPTRKTAGADPAAYFEAQAARNGARWEPTAAQSAAALLLLKLTAEGSPVRPQPAHQSGRLRLVPATAARLSA